MKSSLIDILRNNKLDGGLSLMFHDLLDIKNHYNQAESALKLGKLVNYSAIELPSFCNRMALI